MTVQKLARASIVLASSIFFFSHVFRLPQETFLTTGLGDWMDPYFINSLMEHWYRSIWRLSAPSSPPMFFPVRGTLGYSHGLILYAPFYLAVRPFLHPFQAYSVMLFLVLETGSLCLYVVFRKFFDLGFVEALLLTGFFFSSPNTVNGTTAVWSQRASVFLIPPILLIALAAVRMSEGRLKLTLACFSGLLSTLLFTQDFYTSQLALLVAVLYLAGGLLLEREAVQRIVGELWRTAALVERDDPNQLPRPPNRWWLIVAGIGLAVTIGVMLHPIERMTFGSWRFSATDPARPLFVAVLTGGWFVFRHLNRVVRALHLSRRSTFFSPWERHRPYLAAFALGAFAGCLIFLWIYAGVYWEHRTFPADQLMSSLSRWDPSRWQSVSDVAGSLRVYDSLRSFTLVWLAGVLAWVPWLHVARKCRLYCLWFLLVSFIVLIIPVRFNDFSIWQTFFAPLPGFDAIRDPRRIIQVYELAVVLGTGLVLMCLPRTSLLRLSTVLIMIVLLVTQRNQTIFDFERPIDVYARWVEAPISIDPSCESFFIKGASQAYMSRSPHMATLYGVDSMFISLNHSIPTLNGYSAWSPKGWSLTNPQEPGYAEAVTRWIKQENLRGVCELDIDERTMTPHH